MIHSFIRSLTFQKRYAITHFLVEHNNNNEQKRFCFCIGMGKRSGGQGEHAAVMSCTVDQPTKLITNSPTATNPTNQPDWYLKIR